MPENHIEKSDLALAFVDTEAGCEVVCCRLYLKKGQNYDEVDIMTAATEKLFNDALALPPIERAELIQRLFQSFDASEDHTIDTAWKKEVESRIDAYDKGMLSASLAEEVMTRVNNR